MTKEKAIASGLRELVAEAQGKKVPIRVTTIVPSEIDVQAIREKLNLSQTAFAKHYGFSLSTIRNWEQGRRTPEGAARLLLKLIDNKPDLVNKLLRTATR